MNQDSEKLSVFESVKVVFMIVVFLVAFVVVAQGVLIYEKQKTQQNQ